jgi:adenylosuccinate lyase
MTRARHAHKLECAVVEVNCGAGAIATYGKLGTMNDNVIKSEDQHTSEDRAVIEFGHDTYLSPLTWRYGSDEMRAVWSEQEKRRLLRRFWVALAEAQSEAGVVGADQVADLRAHMDEVDVARATAIEREIRHDLMAEIRVFAEQCPVGGAIIHLGATSMDALDNVDALRLQRSLALIQRELESLLNALARRIDENADLVSMAFTHIQPAEPTTAGYRLAQYAQDLLMDLDEVRRARQAVRGKGLKGAVGTSASYDQLLQSTAWTPRQLEERVMDKLELIAFDVATQTYPRKQDWLVVNALAGLCGSLHKLAFDLRLLQSPPIGEWSEPFAAKQVGSSAMPFKRNPIVAENVDSLARLVAALPRVMWDNAALSLLERTLDDSANRRLVLPEAFLLADEILRRSQRLVEGLKIWPGAVQRNLDAYGAFAATERVLMEAVKAGGDRQALHERIREHSLAAWAAVQAGKLNPLVELLAEDPVLSELLSPSRIKELMQSADHVGDAPERARAMAARIRTEVRAGAIVQE